MLVEKKTKIYIAGHQGMVGSAIVRNLREKGFDNLIYRSREELDLTDPAQVGVFMQSEKPDMVILAAAKVGGIHANNTYPVEFFEDNVMIARNVIHYAYKNNVKRLLFLGSSCIYPREVPQPIKEEYLLSSRLEPTNEAYALAKIGGLKLCQYYRKQYGVMYHSAMPCNLYGVGDNYHGENSHVIPALIKRFHEAKESKKEKVVIWGSGEPRREFLNVDDLAEGIYYLLNEENPQDIVNIGHGEDLKIIELAEIVKEVVGFKGEIELDRDKPDGIMQKLLDVSIISKLGWKPKIALKDGIYSAYKDFTKSFENGLLRVK